MAPLRSSFGETGYTNIVMWRCWFGGVSAAIRNIRMPAEKASGSFRVPKVGVDVLNYCPTRVLNMAEMSLPRPRTRIEDP